LGIWWLGGCYGGSPGRGLELPSKWHGGARRRQAARCGASVSARSRIARHIAKCSPSRTMLRVKLPEFVDVRLGTPL
jgi:hypothetical protein